MKSKLSKRINSKYKKTHKHKSKSNTKKRNATAASVAASATSAASAASSSSSKITLYKNAEDIRMLIMPYRNETATASLYFYFKVGSKNEPVEINGISHFIEHMIFKGSPKFKSYLDISKTFDANGISFNAFTGKDVTAYHFKFLSTSENVDIIC
jgi:predicted Zn-dependent peptidase